VSRTGPPRRRRALDPVPISNRSVTHWLAIWNQRARILGASKRPPITIPHPGMWAATG